MSDSIQACPKCKSTRVGIHGLGVRNDGQSKGYSTCKGCRAKF